MPTMRQPTSLFIVCGYGVPKDVTTDINYRSYLNIAFNSIYATAGEDPVHIILCGGPTNGIPPYELTEAHVMNTYMQTHLQTVERYGQKLNWNIHLEERSLSSLENLVYAKDLIQEKGLTGEITVFCEETRYQRNKTIGEMVFGSPIHVQSIDFDVSKNRYLDPALIEKKERAATESDIWTLDDQDRRSSHHAFYQAKIDWFREQEARGISHVDVVQEWFTTKLWDLTKELMPDHPLLKKEETA